MGEGWITRLHPITADNSVVIEGVSTYLCYT